MEEQRATNPTEEKTCSINDLADNELRFRDMDLPKGQFRRDGRTVRTLGFGVYKICCITGSYPWVIQKDITL